MQRVSLHSFGPHLRCVRAVCTIGDNDGRRAAFQRRWCVEHAEQSNGSTREGHDEYVSTIKCSSNFSFRMMNFKMGIYRLILRFFWWHNSRGDVGRRGTRAHTQFSLEKLMWCKLIWDTLDCAYFGPTIWRTMGRCGAVQWWTAMEHSKFNSYFDC